MFGGSPTKPRLVVIQPSHYCEKAKWALQRYSIEVDLDPQCPGFHSLAAKGKSSTPCLIFPDGTYKDDSSAILAWIDEQAVATGKPQLFPPHCQAEVNADCAIFDAGLGVDARAIIYAHAMDSTAIYNGLTSGTPWWQQLLFSLGVWFVVKGVMRKNMSISAENGLLALERVRAEFARVGQLLADGRAFLHGDTFTAADLCFAALALPVLGVNYGPFPPFAKPEDAPPALRAVFAEMRDTAAGAYALRIWDSQRRVVL